MWRPFRIEGFKAWLFFTPNQYVRAPRKFMCCGARSVATAAEPTAPEMPSYGWQLDDGQVAAVLTYFDSLPSGMFDLPKGSPAPAPKPRLAANM